MQEDNSKVALVSGRVNYDIQKIDMIDKGHN